MTESAADRPAEGAMATLLWAPVNALQAVLAVAWTIACFFGASAAAIVGGRSAGLAFVRRVWAPVALGIAGARTTVRGPSGPPSAGTLFVANHESSLDIPALFVALPVPLYFLVKRELERVPFVGWFCRAVGMVFVERDGGDRARRAIDRSAEVLASGRCMVAFPEGTRGRGEGRRPFKRGPFVAAIKAGAPVVPVAIEGTARVAPPHGLRIRPGRVRVSVGEPLATDGLDLDDRRQLAERAQRAVEAMASRPEGAA